MSFDQDFRPIIKRLCGVADDAPASEFYASCAAIAMYCRVWNVGQEGAIRIFKAKGGPLTSDRISRTDALELVACAFAQLYESEVERMFHKAWNDEALDYLIIQHCVECNGRSYRFDFANPEIRLAIEIDGYAYHSSRESFARDRARDRDCTENGWTVLRFAAKEVMDDAKSCVGQAIKCVKAIMERKA